MKAYIVDDSPISIMCVANMLVNAGIDVKYSLHTDKKLIQRIEQYDPDVIILDIHLGITDGVDLCSVLKQSPILRDKPFVAISSDLGLFTKLRAFSGGFVDYIEKPVERETFLNKVKRYGLIGGLLKDCNKIMNKVYI